ncbi:MAG: TetR/AcrR family transcriptional regulator [Acidobacteriota bacterium]|nr:TetR/AcrR family transcriptional regulator [Acidobacteriota bacterium]
MAEATLNKHQLKTQETRHLLLEAAKTIFARDGYEGAELGEIALLAGRTKGAIYANFASKEEIFLALIEEGGMRARQQMEASLADSNSVEQNRAALRQFFLQLVEDSVWPLLLLEFKLYAIRHPETKQRLEQYFTRMMPADSEERYAKLLGLPVEDTRGYGLRAAIRVLHPLGAALALEARFDETLKQNDEVRQIGDQIFKALL